MKLADLDIKKDQSADWQKLSDITLDNFEHAMNEAQRSGILNSLTLAM